jgi:UDP-glucuronate 4-epimerase
MVRDFTYVDDIVEGVVRVLDRDATPYDGFDSDSPDPARSSVPYRIFNIGNNSPVKLMEFVDAIEEALGRSAEKRFLPLQDGDVPATFADVSELTEWTGFRPRMPVAEGIGRFVRWYLEYYECRASESRT